MKHLLLTTIAAVLVVGCGCKPAWLSIFNAADQGNIEAVKKHLADGVDVNKKDKGGYTPLHWAAFGGHKETVELLIAKGAEVNAKDYEIGATPLDCAIIQDYVEIKKLLVKHGGKTAEELKAATPEPQTAKAPDIPLLEAAMSGNIEAVTQHLAAGTDVDAKSFGLTPLHQAAQFGRKKIIELLIAQGADVNAKDNFGRTPLDCALGGTADLLRKHGGKTGEELKAEGKSPNY